MSNPWSLAAREVHLRVLSLEDAEDGTAVLSADEIARAERYVHLPTRQQFIAARAALRRLLARYLGCSPQRIDLTRNDLGKPVLAGGELHFNVSHSGSLALFAFTTCGEVGVDVERVRPYPDHLGMARRFFHPAEAEALATLPEAGREEAFFRLWTAKEAFLKALGLGLSGGLERVRLSVYPEELRVLAIEGGSAEGWLLTGLEPGEGYVGALAIEAEARVVVLPAGLHGEE